MGRDLYEGFEEIRLLYDEASETLGYDLSRLSFEGPEDELNKTEKTQPCLLTAGIAAYMVLRASGIVPSVVAGHSLGEYTACVASSVMDIGDALRLTEMRGRLMQEAVPEGQGLMAAILGLDGQKVNEICRQVKSGYVEPANYNCPGQVVISGEKKAVEEAMALMKEAGAKKTLPLSVSVPSHSKLMDAAAKRLSEFLFLEDIEIKAPKIPLVSNADAIFLSTADGVRAALVKQLGSPVLWEESIKVIYASGVDVFVEAGPGRVLSGLIKRIAPEVKTLNVQDRESLKSALNELNAL
jgi:[acyl-carrier-protein] S-malonyltransferase